MPRPNQVGKKLPDIARQPTQSLIGLLSDPGKYIRWSGSVLPDKKRLYPDATNPHAKDPAVNTSWCSIMWVMGADFVLLICQDGHGVC
ncbi:hypothetical protein CEXT_452271 [Caerostris extrusa]|uniref:Uncharacterized protein n=1 Tax=Caerostris extrusa TaxID=172846 RepID=A0AAV4YBR0_CAEEX|nr:hypothetical protein CEXT_452271 [Caerostris extrusa]